MVVGGYIIFHPEEQRERVAVTADATVVAENATSRWTGRIWADGYGGNEDPWVFSDPWLYSYCHATQLRRSEMHGGEILFFVSGDQAENCRLVCDTVFVINSRADWRGEAKRGAWMAQEVPASLLWNHRDNTPAWRRHLKFGLPRYGHHAGRHTFVARHYCQNAGIFSFLPLALNGCRVELPFNRCGRDVQQALAKGLPGKYPALLSPAAAHDLYRTLTAAAAVRVVGGITEQAPRGQQRAAGCGRCDRERLTPGCR